MGGGTGSPENPGNGPDALFWIGLDKAQSGIYLEGQIIARSREKVKMGEEEVVKIKYRIATLGPDVMLEDMRPPGFLTVGQSVRIPVFIRPFARRNGTAAFGVSVARPMAERGEDF